VHGGVTRSNGPRSHLINLLRAPSRRSGSLRILQDSSGALPSLGALATVYEMTSSVRDIAAPHGAAATERWIHVV
jgi:hypothetical protein